MQRHNYSNDNELYHYGRKGMKWGQHIYGRLYRNKDGTLTSLGRKKAIKYAKKYKQVTGGKPTQANIAKTNKQSTKDPKTQSKSVKDMTDDELRRRINRLQLEKQLKDLQPAQISSGKHFVNNIVKPAATDAGKQLLKEWMIKEGKKALGLSTNNNNQKNKKKDNK